jgi:hypothetical protein
MPDGIVTDGTTDANNRVEMETNLARWGGEAAKAWFNGLDDATREKLEKLPGQQLFVMGWKGAKASAAGVLSTEIHSISQTAAQCAAQQSTNASITRAAAYAARQIREVWTPESTYQKVHRSWALELLDSALGLSDEKPRSSHEDLPDEIKEACETFLGPEWKTALDAIVLGLGPDAYAGDLNDDGDIIGDDKPVSWTNTFDGDGNLIGSSSPRGIMDSVMDSIMEQRFEKWWAEHGVKTSQPTIDLVFKEIAEKAWNAGRAST